MSNSQAVADSFRSELWNGIHAFGPSVVRAATTKDTFNIAVYTTSASLGAGTTAYSSTNEISSAGYTAGGQAVTNANAPTVTSSIMYWQPSASVSWTGITAGPMDAFLLYNATQGNKAVASFTFGSQTITAGNFAINMPANDNSHALLRMA